ncbi:SRPBCC family protein [Kutzneria viridogrisea]|uniref:Polyketide cyclase/dehydrase n=2 Tax=Kutzneria TaxID=43356 RepID=W5WD03_9PSEU|nr:SRPBCC family protein [Kutzneria albida]AHH98451.1 hypothetical protein KALB_5089 [Kutzneria albida DSM 43870]MBA8923964.1 uncharacterized protein YndB with AHSA1/START domain [Kutzneria viridogrisea]
MTEYHTTRKVSVPPDSVWAVLADHEGMPRWTASRSAHLERIGDQDRNGVGAIRALGTPVGRIREEITEFDAPNRLVYRMLSGAPVRDYVGTVRLSPDGAGTLIEWSVSFVPRLPGVQLVIKALIGQLATGLAKESARRG